MANLIIYVLLCTFLNGALVIRTIFSFRGKFVATLTTTIYATFAMLVGYYTVIMNGINLPTKILITILTASVGVYLGKCFEEKIAKTQIFQYEITILSELESQKLQKLLKNTAEIAENHIETSNGTVYNLYATSKKPYLIKELQKITKNCRVA